MDELSRNVEIEGRIYFQPYNDIIGQQIDYMGLDYRLAHKTDCYCTEIYKLWANEKKMIGKLVFNHDTNKLILHKFIKTEKHEMHKTSEFGINEKIFKNLRVCDLIVFHIDKVCYTITVSKALKVGNYKNFKGSYNSEDLQFFINIEHLKKLEERKNGKKKSAKRVL